MLDGLIRDFIKKGKAGIEEGTCTLDEYTKALSQIYEKMNEFNGMTREEFYNEVEKI